MNATASLSYRIPFADTDQMGVVYYANYLIYFEMCRAELMREIGFSYTEMEHLGYAMPVIEAVCRYKSPAHFEDRIVITATVLEMKGVRAKIGCTIHRGEELLAEGWTEHVCVDSRTAKPTRIPEKLITLSLNRNLTD